MLEQNGGQANTTEIKRATGWSSSVIHYRYDKLVDTELVVTYQGSTTTDRIPPTVATLTDDGEAALEAGLVGAFDVDELDVRNLREKMDHVEHQVERDVKQEYGWDNSMILRRFKTSKRQDWCKCMKRTI